MTRDRFRHATHRGVADRQFEREAPADAERRQRDDEGMRQPAEDVDDAVDGADGRAGREHRQHHQRRGIDAAEDEAADDGRKRQVGADREIDAAGQDDELLAHRDDGDHRRLSEDVAEVAGLQEIGRQQADDRGQRMRISSGPMLRSLRPSETAVAPPERRRSPSAPDAMSGCSRVRVDHGAPHPAITFLIEKNQHHRLVNLFFMD